ncbi:MAG: glutathione peroxidase, partial [Myxococcales bacterium]
VNGESAAPVYQFLTSQQVGPEEAGDIKWNFGKFLVDGEGKVVARFAPTVTPDDPELVERIEKTL